jgi:tetratricopeptide (TPR) repeat protein
MNLTPFQRRLQEVSEEAKSDPRSAFNQLEALYGQSLTSQDVQALFTFATHLGATVLGNLTATAAFLHKCLEHPALEPDSEELASLQRARLVVALCMRDEKTAAEARAAGVRHAGEEARSQALAAQALIARLHFPQATKHLEAAQEALLANEDPQQAMTVGSLAVNLAATAQQMLGQMQQTVLTITALAEDGFSVDEQWQNQHQIMHLRGRAFWQCGKIGAALEQVQRMLALEETHDAGPAQRFLSASLACLCQMARGQKKIAAGAFQACESFMHDLSDDKERATCERLLEEVKQIIEADKATEADLAARRG